MKADLSKSADLKNAEWLVSKAFVPYEEAVAAMEKRVEAIFNGRAPELVWLLGHPPLYTAGTGSTPDDLIHAGSFPVFKTGRGGRMTYHGPGQRVVYAMCDLRARGKDLRAHVAALEEWIIRVLDDFGVRGERRKGRVGIWVARDNGSEEKIAAIGVRVRRWITYHGLSLNVNPDLSHFDGIVPCGIKDHGVTSLHALGVKASMTDVDKAFRRRWSDVFG